MNWLKNKWNKFELWVASFLPGWKTKIVVGLGIVGTVVATFQEYLTGLPLEQLVSPTKLAIANALMYSIAYWTKRLSDKED